MRSLTWSPSCRSAKSASWASKVSTRPLSGPNCRGHRACGGSDTFEGSACCAGVATRARLTAAGKSGALRPVCCVPGWRCHCPGRARVRGRNRGRRLDSCVRHVAWPSPRRLDRQPPRTDLLQQAKSRVVCNRRPLPHRREYGAKPSQSPNTGLAAKRCDVHYDSKLKTCRKEAGENVWPRTWVKKGGLLLIYKQGGARSATMTWRVC